jgi:polyribonucleotide nucleotidyltransferase
MHCVTVDLAGRTLVFEVGEVARQAHGSAVVRTGATVVLATVVLGEVDHPELGYVPLSVEYRERYAGVGRLPPGARRREGGITDPEILASRVIDRTLRPLLARDFRRDIQLQVVVHSADARDMEALVPASIAASLALSRSGVPFLGPAGVIRVVDRGAEVLLAPPAQARAGARADLLVGLGRQGVTMLEGGASEVAEARIVALLDAARGSLDAVFAAISEFGPARPPAPREIRVLPASLRARLLAERGPMLEASRLPDKTGRRAALEAARARFVAAAAQEAPGCDGGALFDREWEKTLREGLLEGSPRLDGRRPGDVRPISARLGYLPAAHGSALFTRGETQALVSCTLGGPAGEAAVESPLVSERSRFYLHYAFPSFSVGEVRPNRGPSRREIGHGALAERALRPVIPGADRFPHTIRIESDILESNGSSSMATVCGASLALEDAGVPIARLVAGVAMGLISEGGRSLVLTDILGDEDHLGDMDCKVAGTCEGITALQMDNKLGSLGREALEAALVAAREARLRILESMAAILEASPRRGAPRGPQVVTERVAPDLIGLLIGPKGSTIKGIQAEFGVEVAVDDEGRVTITAPDAKSAEAARARVRELAGTVDVGEVYEGRVLAVRDFGAIVRIFERAEGLVHISEWDRVRVASMAEVAREGDRVRVRVLAIDARGKLKLSRAQAEEPERGAAPRR